MIGTAVGFPTKVLYADRPLRLLEWNWNEVLRPESAGAGTNINIGFRWSG